MKQLLLIFFALLILTTTANAGLMDGPGNPYLSNGDFVVGGKLAFVGVYGSNVGFILGGEYGFKEGFLSIPNFPTSLGLGGSIGYSSYSKNVDSYPDYLDTNFLIFLTGYYHVHLLKEIPIDTYAMLNIGVNIATSNYEGNLPNAPKHSNPHGGLTFGSGIGARYYFTNKLSAVGELGFGMGVIRLGLDFRI